MKKTSLSVISLLLSTSSVNAMKLMNNNQATCMAQQDGTKGGPQDAGNPAAAVMIQALKEVGGALQSERHELVNLVGGAQHGIGELGNQCGIAFTEADGYDPDFIADLLLGAYGAQLKELENHSDEIINELARNMPRFAQKEKELAEVSHNPDGSPDAEEMKNGPGGPPGMRGPPMNPRDYCISQGPDGGVKCQIFMAMPPASMILDQWAGALSGIQHNFQDHKENIVRDIDMFNQMLTHQAEEQGVAPPKSLPDPQELADKLGKTVDCVQGLTQKYRNEAIAGIQQAEAQIAQQLAMVYMGAAGVASQFEPSVNPNSLPRSEGEALTLGRGILMALDKGVHEGQADPIFREIIGLVERAGISKNDTPSVQDMQNLVDGLIMGGMDQLQPRDFDRQMQRDMEMANQAEQQMQEGMGKCECKDGEFCNNDFGPGAGRCEQCPSDTKICWTDGLPQLGAMECEQRCFAMSPEDAAAQAVMMNNQAMAIAAANADMTKVNTAMTAAMPVAMPPMTRGPTSMADDAFQLCGSQEDYDRVMAVPEAERGNEFTKVVMEMNTKWADDAFQLRGSQEDYDRVMAKDACSRRPEFQVIQTEVQADPPTKWADDAFQLRGSQEDYDRVMAVPQSQRQTVFVTLQVELAAKK